MILGIEGVGQMGMYYLKLALKLGMSLDDIWLWDIDPTRLETARAIYPSVRIASSFAEFAAAADAFIVAVNTPAHHEEIRGLAEHGARRVLVETGLPPILCEKPLALNVVSLQKIRAVERSFPGLDISTAMVIAFSPTRGIIADRMETEGLSLRTCVGRWGKNRGRSDEFRPTAGDRVDELVHMAEFLLSLMQSDGIRFVDVVAQVEYLRYANADSQREAHERDPSFPLVPDSSTQALLSVMKESGEVAQMALASSFLEAEQVRDVGGTLTHHGTDEPVYSFNVHFDVKGSDHLTLTHVRTNEVERRELTCDKLLALTEAFFVHAQGGARDSRLASVEWSGAFVDLMEAIGESDELRRAEKAHRCRVSFEKPLERRAFA